MKWKDITSYSQGEKHPRTPRAWEADFDLFKVTVHRSRDYPGAWLFYTIGSIAVRGHLKSVDLEEAKGEAIIRVKELISKLRDAFRID